ncbi:hypothetical protein BCR36DRAFT_587130 [Piromyces finnis]|uniref:Uncharacterized protein n=1 Tax=Piromyces finnis TaxID=1754191 RepID=A0A1Y1UYZ2_9FUNG|nr:hypothetical protein BCR36DRAFT_587130 [Piromyces finnis]|eukprot:ORX42554.1 hypothetical protein BCR36DRAFT_587130 [Piromyces finnis]
MSQETINTLYTNNLSDKYVETIYVNDKNGHLYQDINEKNFVGARLIMIIIILSWWLYGKYAYLCIRGLIRHKNFNFIFPFTAAIFAFANNTNDIFHFIYHPKNCHPFWIIFTASATLNWAPISWLQAYRLILIAKIYLSKKGYYFISFLAVAFSATYSTFYFLNLNAFNSERNFTNGCSPTNPGTYTRQVMIFDIIDSVFSIAMLCVLVYRSVKNLKEMNTRNERLNDLVGQGVIELIIIGIAKVIIYPIIIATSEKPGFDCFWDILSVIVIISAFKMVNFPYERNDFDKQRRNNLRKRVFNFIDSNVGKSSSNEFLGSSMYNKFPKIETSNGYNSPNKEYSSSYSVNSSNSTAYSPNYNSNFNLSDPKSYKPIIKNDIFNNPNYNYNNLNSNNNNANAFNNATAATTTTTTTINTTTNATINNNSYNLKYNSLKRNNYNV